VNITVFTVSFLSQITLTQLKNQLLISSAAASTAGVPYFKWLSMFTRHYFCPLLGGCCVVLVPKFQTFFVVHPCAHFHAHVCLPSKQLQSFLIRCPGQSQRAVKSPAEQSVEAANRARERFPKPGNQKDHFVPVEKFGCFV
jgi:hypothetical protein